MKKNVSKIIKVFMLLSAIILSNTIFGQQKKEITRKTTLIQNKDKRVSLEEQLKSLNAEEINSLIKDRKVSVESVFNKIKKYKPTTDSNLKKDLILDLCTLSNSELNDLLSRFGEKNEKNAKLDIAFANYFKKADELVSQNIFIASLDKSKSEKLNTLNKTTFNGGFKRPEIMILGIADSDCHNVYCYRCPGAGCIPYSSLSADTPENLSKPKCPPGYTLMPNGDCAPNEDLPKEMPKDRQIIKQVKTVSLEEQLKALNAEEIYSLIKNRKVSVESMYDKIKTYKPTTDTNVKTDLILDLCSLSNSELNNLLSRFGEKNEENAKLDIAFANYFKRANALVGENVFIASLDKTKSEKLDALNKTIVNGSYKRPEFIFFGIAEADCSGKPCRYCHGAGCLPIFIIKPNTTSKN